MPRYQYVVFGPVDVSGRGKLLSVATSETRAQSHPDGALYVRCPENEPIVSPFLVDGENGEAMVKVQTVNAAGVNDVLWVTGSDLRYVREHDDIGFTGEDFGVDDDTVVQITMPALHTVINVADYMASVPHSVCPFGANCVGCRRSRQLVPDLTAQTVVALPQSESDDMSMPPLEEIPCAKTVIDCPFGRSCISCSAAKTPLLTPSLLEKTDDRTDSSAGPACAAICLVEEGVSTPINPTGLGARALSLEVQLAPPSPLPSIAAVPDAPKKGSNPRRYRHRRQNRRRKARLQAALAAAAPVPTQ